MNKIHEMLGGGDLRSEGRAAEVAAFVIANPRRLPSLAKGLALEDKLLRARTCMALEVISRTHADLLEPLVPDLIRTAEGETVAQARWHLAEILCKVPLDDAQAEEAIPTLLGYLEDKSKIVTHCAVLALGVLGKQSSRRAEIVAAMGPHGNDSKSIGKAIGRAVAGWE